jgi:hypothetical protein
MARSVLAKEDGRLADPGVAGEDSLDLPQLHALASDFYLSVDSPAELQLPSVIPVAEVAGAVHAAAGWAERVGDETFGGECGTAEIAAG